MGRLEMLSNYLHRLALYRQEPHLYSPGLVISNLERQALAVIGEQELSGIPLITARITMTTPATASCRRLCSLVQRYYRHKHGHKHRHTYTLIYASTYTTPDSHAQLYNLGPVGGRI